MLRPFQEDARKEVVRLVKIRVSYERPEELEEVVSRFGDRVERVRSPSVQGPGRFCRAYIDLKGQGPSKMPLAHSRPGWYNESGGK